MIALDPNLTTEFSLKSDAETPAESRPTFVTRYLTAREYARVDDLFAQSLAPDVSLADGAQLQIAALRIGLVGWRNLPVAFAEDGVDALLDCLTYGELSDVVLGMQTAVQLGEIALKNSGSPSHSVAAACAPDAEDGPAPESRAGDN